MGTAMRADAQRNREQILRAAREVFVHEGPDAPLDEIARRAGVGIATLYRRFPSREDLIQGVAVDTLGELYEAAVSARARSADAFEALQRFMHAALDIKVGAVMPILSGRVAVEEVLAKVRDVVEPVQELIVQAQEARLLREDVVIGDITLMMIRLTRPLPGGQFREDGGLAHRQLELYIDGLRPVAADARTGPLPAPGIGVDWFRRIRSRLVASRPPASRSPVRDAAHQRAARGSTPHRARDQEAAPQHTRGGEASPERTREAASERDPWAARRGRR